MSITIWSHESLQMEIWNSLSEPFFMTYEHWTWSVFCFQLAHVWTCLVLHISWVHVAAASCLHHLILLQTSVGVNIKQHIAQLAFYHNLFPLWLWQYLTLKVWMYKCELHVQIFPQFWSQHGDTTALGCSRQLWAARASVRSYKHSFSPWHSGPDRPSTQHTWWVIIFHNQANCDCNTNHCFNKPPLTPLSSSHAHTRVFIPVLCTETVFFGIFKGFHFKWPLLLKFLNFDSDPTTLHRSIIYTQYSE